MHFRSFGKIREFTEIEAKMIDLKKDYNLAKATIDDLNLRLTETTKEHEKFKIMSEYYLKELNQARVQYSELLKMVKLLIIFV